MAVPKAWFLCLDKNRALWVREGENLFVPSAMCYWDGKLVMGCGDADATNDRPNLVYLNKTVLTDQGIISGGALTTEVIESSYDTMVFGAESNDRKECRRWELTYEDKTTYQTTGVEIWYRRDYGAWTSLKTITFSRDGAIKVTGGDKGIQGSAILWQFKFISDDDFKIISFVPYLYSDPLAQR